MTITRVELIEPGLAKIWGQSGDKKIVSQPWIYTMPQATARCAQCGANLEKGRIAYRALCKSAKDKLCVMCIEQPAQAPEGNETR